MLMKVETALVSGAGETHRGGRSSNQDVLVVEPDLGLYGVFDGMGGHAAGEVAARIASETLVEFVRTHAASERFSPRELLEFAIDRAAAAVYDAGRQPECKGMGTTVVACLVVDPTRAVIGYVGDSRAYRLHDHRLQLLTRDHTIAQQLVELGDLTPEAAQRSYFSNVLTRNLGLENGVQADTLDMLLQAGDRILLCSDGLHGCLSPVEIQSALAAGDAAPNVVAQTLVELALTNQALDNVSVVVLEVAEP